MHANAAFRRTPRGENLDFARGRGFGALCVNAPTGPLISHIPYLIDAEGAEVELLVRANPILRLLETPQPAVIAVSGPDGYVSPDWYAVADQVPTWNYIAVHLRGALEVLPHEALEPMLDRLTAAFETRLAPKRPWTTGKMSEGVMDRMMRAITPCRLRIDEVQGTWKLNQNKPEAVRQAAADGVAGAGLGKGVPGLAALMRAAKAPPPA